MTLEQLNRFTERQGISPTDCILAVDSGSPAIIGTVSRAVVSHQGDLTYIYLTDINEATEWIDLETGERREA